MLPQRVLLCGWGETQFMADLLAELDHGPSALPPGSSVTLLNSRPTSHIMGAGHNNNPCKKTVRFESWTTGHRRRCRTSL